MSTRGNLYSPFRDTPIHRNRRNIANNVLYSCAKERELMHTGELVDTTTKGIHVYVTKKDAISECGPGYVLLRIQVSSFLASGYFGDAKSETWKSYKVLSVTKLP
jgi:hypothetical protein